MNKKDKAYYMSLNYSITVKKMEHPEGGYYAQYPDFGACGAHGDGVTIDEAIQQASISKELYIDVALEKGKVIPEPDDYDRFSGKFITRVPKSLHAELAKKAEAEGVSLNSLVISLLSQQVGSGVTK